MFWLSFSPIARRRGSCIISINLCVSLVKNTPRSEHNRLSQVLGIWRDVNLGNYLGLPTDIGNSKCKAFGFMKDKLRMKLEGWNENQLNQARKEVLLKSVAMALPNYVMSCVKLPEKLCKELNGMMARFWSGSKDNNRKIHRLAWEDLCEEKRRGWSWVSRSRVF